MFFFNMASEIQPDEDVFMKQRPFNDNLVMASIENLYEQASDTLRPNTTSLQRHNPYNLPIIGSLPIQIGQEEETNQFNDVVLTGRSHAAFSDESLSTIAIKSHADGGQADNPFLAIRQAVISAGDENSEKLKRPVPSSQEKLGPDTTKISAPDTMLPDKLPSRLLEQNFADHLANLIDSEIERRLKIRMQTVKKPIKKPTTQTSSKQRTAAKKSKQKKPPKPATKKQSTTKRKKPK